MKFYIVDTNIILRYLLNDNQRQAKIAHTLFSQAKKNKLVLTVPVIVFLEAVYILMKLYREPKLEVVQKLTILARFTYLDIEKRNIVISALSLFASQSISIADCILYIEARVTDKELLTFDKRLKRLKISV